MELIMAIIAACSVHTGGWEAYRTQRDCQRAVIRCVKKDIGDYGAYITNNSLRQKERSLIKCLQKKEF